MAIIWCDWATGSDDTGDGSQGSPYKTITKASTGLTGGDEVRVGQSAADTAISANLTWTNGSRTVTAVGDITGEVAQYDIIAKASHGGPGDAETVYEVGAISYAAGTGLTTITLGTETYHTYVGTTETVASVKINATSTGAAASSSTNVQTVSASGTSAEAMLTISGGWDLVTGLQTGQTWFVQRHGTPATKSGRGLYSGSKSWYTVIGLGFLRYNYGIYLTSSNNNTLTSNTATSNYYGIYLTSSSNNNTLTSNTATSNSTGIYLSSSSNNTLTSNTATSNSTGISLTSSSNNTLTSNTANSNNNYGISLTSSSNNNTLTSNTAKSNSTGISLTSSSNNTLTSNTAKSNNNYGIYLTSSSNNTLTSNTATSNSTGISLTSSSSNVGSNNDVSSNSSANISISRAMFAEYPCISLGRAGGVFGADTQYFEYGTAARDDTEYHTAAPSLKFTPSSNTYYIRQDFNCGPAAASTGYTLSVWLRKSATFNGDVRLEALNTDGLLVTGPTAAAVTEDWAQYSIAIDAADMPAAGIVTLRVRVRGTAGTVWADTVAVATT